MYTTPKYVGITFMGPNYSAPDIASDAYVWDTLADIQASADNIGLGYGVRARVAEWADDESAYAGAYDDSRTPCADSVRILVWHNVPGTLTGAYEATPDYVVYIGARGGIRVSRDWSAGLDLSD